MTSTKAQDKPPAEQITSRLRQLFENTEKNTKTKDNIREISHIGRHHGFGEDSEIRLQAYMLLLGIENQEIIAPFVPHVASPGEEADIQVISRNCSGSFRVFDACINESTERIQQLRQDLEDIMVKLFHENKQFHYFRGYENFCSVILQHFDALEVAIDKSVELQVRNIFDIVKREDSQVAQIFSVTHFLAFCVSWVLTWFAFNIRKSKDLLRIYDFLVSSPPESMVLLGAAFILGTKDIMKEHIQECQEGGEIGVLFGIYQNLWQVDYDMEHIINLAIHLQKSNAFTPSMRQLYATESIMHEDVLTSLLPCRRYLIRNKSKHLFKYTLILTTLVLLLCIFIAIIYD